MAHVIRHTAHRDLFWSNDDGWVDFCSATRFTMQETKYVRLPLEGEWVDTTTTLEQAAIELANSGISIYAQINGRYSVLDHKGEHVGSASTLQDAVALARCVRDAANG